MPTRHSLLGEPNRCVALSVSGEALGRQSSLDADIYRGLPLSRASKSQCNQFPCAPTFSTEFKAKEEEEEEEEEQ